MKQTKRIISVILSLMMLIGVVPALEVVAASSFELPLKDGNIITFGFGAKSSSGTYHLGIDYGNTGNVATDVRAIADGVVYSFFKTSVSGGWGNLIIIKHETTNGKYYFSGYGHMVENSVSVSVGDIVTCGTKLGVMGSTGKSTGPHVHLLVCTGISSTSTLPSGYNASSFSGTVTKNGITYYNPSVVISSKGTCIYGTETISKAAPGKPTLTVSPENVSNKNVILTWNKVNNVDHYDLRVYNYGNYNVGAPYGEWGIAASRMSSSIKLPKGKYAAYITAVSSSGAESSSNWPVFIVSDPPGTPVLTINNIIVTDNIDKDGVEFKWTKASNTDHYDLRVYNHGDYNTGAPFTAFNLPASQTSTKMKLPIGKYAAYITAVAESGAGAPSEWITVFNVFEPDADPNFPKNILTYKMWTGDSSTAGFECDTYNYQLLKDSQIKLLTVYNNNWVKAEAKKASNNETKTVYIPLGNIISTPCAVTTKYCKASTSVYARYNNTTVQHTLAKDAAVKVIGTHQDTRTQICYTVSGQSYIGWVLNDTLCAHSSTGHSYTSKVTKAATCSATGIKTYTCSCGDSYTETITTNPNNHVNTKNVAATASTCTVKGYTAGVYCNDCKKYISGHAEQPLAAHKTTTQNAKAATCTAEGYTGDQVCSVCKQTITKGTAIAKKAHTLTTQNAKAATCTAEGYTGDQVCTVCKQTITKGTAIAKKAHTLTTVNQKNAGCTTTGYTGDQYCTTCKQTITRGNATNALGHTSPDGNGNCTRCGQHIKDVTPSNPQPNPNACKYCGKVHTGPFGWLIKFFHSILAIFKR